MKEQHRNWVSNIFCKKRKVIRVALFSRWKEIFFKLKTENRTLNSRQSQQNCTDNLFSTDVVIFWGGGTKSRSRWYLATDWLFCNRNCSSTGIDWSFLQTDSEIGILRFPHLWILFLNLMIHGTWWLTSPWWGLTQSIHAPEQFVLGNNHHGPVLCQLPSTTCSPSILCHGVRKINGINDNVLKMSGCKLIWKGHYLN